MAEKVSVKGIGSKTPLKRFIGKLKSFDDAMTQYNRRQISLNFVDVIVKESDEPYPFPTAQIQLNYSRHPNSGWAAFAESLNTFLGESEDFDNCVGRSMELLRGTKNYGPGDDGKDMTGTIWTVMALEGSASSVKVETKSAEDIALDILDGKTLAAFNLEVLKVSAIKDNEAIRAKILNNALVSEFLAADKITLNPNTGTFHKK